MKEFDKVIEQYNNIGAKYHLGFNWRRGERCRVK